MTITDCAYSCGRSSMTIRRWIKKYNIPFKKDLSGKVSVTNVDWNDFCIDKNIERVK